MTVIVQRLGKREIDHELIWGAIIVCVLVAARWFPFDLLPPPACPFKLLTRVPCCTCGMTRSLLAFAHGDFMGALYWNPLIGLCSLGAVAYFVYAAIVLVFDLPRIRWSLTRRWERVCVRLIAVFVFSANWIYLIVAGR
ncbi:MAG: DUF2752 domain-containing protein [bacterium]